VNIEQFAKLATGFEWKAFLANAALSKMNPATVADYTLSLHDALPISRTLIGRTVRVSRPSMRASPSRICLRTIFDSSAKQISLTDRKSTRLNSSHVEISYAVFCLKKKKKIWEKVAYAAVLYVVNREVC